MEADGSVIITSDHALCLECIPASIIILGAGAIGMEFAYVLSTFGAEVTVLELLPRPLPLEDEDVSAEIQRLYRKRCRIVCAVRVTGAERTPGGVAVVAEDAEGSVTRYEAEQLLVAVGRKPLSEGLGLEECGVRVDRGRVVCDGTMRTDNPRVFAIGDVVGRLPLAHTASAEAHVAVDAMLGRPAHELDYASIPRATYCIPEVASVGLTEAEAQSAGMDAVAAKTTFRSIGKAVASGEYEGFCKVVANRGTGALLGLHIVGPHATELIGEASLAMAMRATVRDMAHTVHAHPTLSEILMETAAQLAL
jgi:dihydrolipoamide dehydrogenase